VDKQRVIVGGGHAAAQFCASMTELDPGAGLTLISDESHLPYQRPPLSKSFLKEENAGSALLRAASFYADRNVTVRLGQKIRALDCETQRLTFESGEQLEYGQLVLATGTRPRMAPLFDGGYANVHTLRTVDDAQRLRTGLHAAQKVLVIGGGFIGLEVASTAAQLGKQVTVLEAAPRLLGRSGSPLISAYVLEQQRANGVDVRLGEMPERPEIVDGLMRGVHAGGEFISTDIVIVGIGAVPNQELAQAAGLACDNGIVVDACMRTSDPAIFAIGDCTSFPSATLHRRIRLESVQNAVDQARCAALAVAGRPEPYTALPWFWSDQGATRIQIAGLWAPEHRQVLRGDPDSNRFSVLHYAGDLLTSVESINSPADHIAARKLIASARPVPPEQAIDASVPLKSFE
jgi:3-phenylpropionate/trans-cinnamate dioxygenase ferredoxin reductase subunit